MQNTAVSLAPSKGSYCFWDEESWCNCHCYWPKSQLESLMAFLFLMTVMRWLSPTEHPLHVGTVLVHSRAAAHILSQVYCSERPSLTLVLPHLSLHVGDHLMLLVPCGVPLSLESLLLLFRMRASPPCKVGSTHPASLPTPFLPHQCVPRPL